MLQGLLALANQRPIKAVDSQVDEVTQRGNPFGEKYVAPTCPDGLTAYLNESSYMSGVLSGYVPGSGNAVAAVQTSFSDTSALLLLRNNAPLNGPPVAIRPDTLKLIVSGAGTGLTAMRLVTVLDDAARWGANPGGAALAFAPSSNVGLNQVALSQAVIGNVGPQAPTPNKRIVGQCVLKAAAPVVNDELVIRFSNAAQPSGSIAGTTAATIVRHMEPVLIGPGKMLLLHAFFPGATAAPSFEPLLTVIER